MNGIENSQSLMHSSEATNPIVHIVIFVLFGVCVASCIVFTTLLIYEEGDTSKICGDDNQNRGSRYSRAVEDEDRRLAK